MPGPDDVPGYWDIDGQYWVYGANSPQEFMEMLASGNYGIEVGTVNGEDYIELQDTGLMDLEEILDTPVDELDGVLYDSGPQSA
jgi:trehalose-6-phosphatase